MVDCHNCAFASNVSGSTHIQCNFVKEKLGPHAILFAINPIVSLKDVKDVLGFGFNEHGVKNGWCQFPLNYDPVWLEGECNIKKALDKSEAMKSKELK